jgi:hypothetical protein
MEQVLLEQALPSGAGPGYVTDIEVRVRTTDGETILLTHKPSINPMVSSDMRVRLTAHWVTDGTGHDEIDRHMKMVRAQVEREREAARKREREVAAEIEAAFEGQEIPEKLRAVVERAREEEA